MPMRYDLLKDYKPMVLDELNIGLIICTSIKQKVRKAIMVFVGKYDPANKISALKLCPNCYFYMYYSDPVGCIAFMKECGLTPEKILTVVQQNPDILYLYKEGRRLSYNHNQDYIDSIIRRYLDESGRS